MSLIRWNFVKLGWEKTVYFLATLCLVRRCEGDLICPCIFLVVLKKYRPNFECYHICRVIVLCASLGKGVAYRSCRPTMSLLGPEFCYKNLLRPFCEEPTQYWQDHRSFTRGSLDICRI